MEYTVAVKNNSPTGQREELIDIAVAAIFGIASMDTGGAFTRRKYCSLRCANTKKKVGYHGLSFRARRHLSLTCELCGSNYYLAAHHKDGNRANNVEVNIRTRCVKCHAKLHHGTLGKAV